MFLSYIRLGKKTAFAFGRQMGIDMLETTLIALAFCFV